METLVATPNEGKPRFHPKILLHPDLGPDADASISQMTLPSLFLLLNPHTFDNDHALMTQGRPNNTPGLLLHPELFQVWSARELHIPVSYPPQLFPHILSYQSLLVVLSPA